MMRFPFLIFLIVLAGCQQSNRFQVNGILTDSSFNGKWLYLVPFENATLENVDSTLISNNEFHFEGTANRPEIAIIRAKPALRFELQELLVVKEQGTINVTIGASSSARGTALNDSLQLWKQRKILADNYYNKLKEQYQTADSITRLDILEKAGFLNLKISEMHFNFVKNNLENPVGQMVCRITENSFTPQQKLKLGLR